MECRKKERNPEGCESNMLPVAFIYFAPCQLVIICVCDGDR